MAESKAAVHKPGFHLRWRGPAVFLLTFIGVIALVGYLLVHWTERQLLTTDNWVKLVAPMPKDNSVATALSTYSVNKLFTEADLETKIEQVLPPQAALLLQPLPSSCRPESLC